MGPTYTSSDWGLQHCMTVRCCFAGLALDFSTSEGYIVTTDVTHEMPSPPGVLLLHRAQTPARDVTNISQYDRKLRTHNVTAELTPAEAWNGSMEFNGLLRQARCGSLDMRQSPHRSAVSWLWQRTAASLLDDTPRDARQ